MEDALEVIEKVISQHSKLTENVKTTGEKMNDIDAVFISQRETYKTAHGVSSVNNLLDKRDQLLQSVNILGDGLKKHFDYEEKVLPLVFGEFLMKDVLHDHHEILEKIENARASLVKLEKLNREELPAKRLEILQNINDISKTVLNHKRYEEKILNLTKTVFKEKEDYRE
ncbi:MAG: hemerythrin domain-containing protein [Dehalococcoidales bacterium]|nr:hemerythrin domain-containing protein [Dehalococcoidales bacterium]